jgi:hypothetical protein
MRYTIITSIGLIAVALRAQETATELTLEQFKGSGEAVKELERAGSQTVPFAAGGLIRIDGSYGDLTIEGSDAPDVEIGWTKALGYGSSDRDKPRFDKVKVNAMRTSDSELAITIEAPSPNKLLHPLATKNDRVALEVSIRVPRNSRLVIHHGVGLVSVENVTGDLDIHGSRGDLYVELPEGGPYAIDAKTKLGVVNSDFAGSPKMRPYRMGENFATQSPATSSKIRLRMGFGGITVKRLVAESTR